MNPLRKIFELTTIQFGFDGFDDFSKSLLHTNWLFLTIPFATISGLCNYWFGLNPATIFAFIALITLELATGLWASKIKKIKWESRKFSRFGLKILTWLTLISVINTLKHQYSPTLTGDAFGVLHSVIFVYVCLEYLLSVIENFGVITGKSYVGVIRLIRSKFPFLPTEEESFFGEHDRYMLIVEKNGGIKKSNQYFYAFNNSCVANPQEEGIKSILKNPQDWDTKIIAVCTPIVMVDDVELELIDGRKLIVDVKLKNNEYWVIAKERFG